MRCCDNQRELTGWLIAYGWLWPTKASFLHSKNLVGIQVAMTMIATIAATMKCPEGEVRIHNTRNPSHESHACSTR